MPCYNPLKAFRTPSGGVTFSPREGVKGTDITLPCGKCIGCMQARAREWGLRLEHEHKCHKKTDCFFVTLTYDADNLPSGGRLDDRDLTLYFKRLRYSLGRNNHFRYFAVGEYGGQNHRPHFHILFFGISSNNPKKYGHYNDETIVGPLETVS